MLLESQIGRQVLDSYLTLIYWSSVNAFRLARLLLHLSGYLISYSHILTIMKKNISDIQKTAKAEKGKKTPANKNVLDSRKNEEFGLKGDDITHNKKETKSLKKK